jgi:YHS domain-containing protein
VSEEIPMDRSPSDEASRHLPPQSAGARAAKAEEELPAKRPLIFGGLFSRLFGAGEPSSPKGEGGSATSPRPLDRLEHELQKISDHAGERLRELEAAGRKEAAGAVTGPAAAAEKDRLLEEREEARRTMDADIARLHEQLDTGIDEVQRERLSRLLSAHACEPDAPPTAAIEDRIERAVLQELYRRASQEAWQRLEGLVERSGLVWPVQEGLSESAAPEELDRLRERHRKEIHAAFLVSSPGQTADLIRGEVGAWRYSYPDRHSYLWLQIALRGVAAALTAQFFAAALEIWMWRTAELERELFVQVDRSLEGARLSLRAGIGSLAEAVEVASRVDEVCETVIPSLLWSQVAPKLGWVRANEAAPAISVLAAGVSNIDPVCGMSLTSQRVAARTTREGQSFYFCGPACRRLFEASPSRFSAYTPSGQKEPTRLELPANRQSREDSQGVEPERSES